MDKLRQLLNRYTQRMRMEQVAASILSRRQFAEWVLDLNRNDQLLSKGVDTTGRVIGYYSVATEKITKGRKRAGTPYTLKDTGLFFSTFDLIVESDGFRIEANGKIGKKDDIIAKYGEEVLGLTSTNLDRFRRRFSEEIQQYVKREIIRTT